MPLYTFTCPTCGHEQEELMRADERTRAVITATACPDGGEGCALNYKGVELVQLRDFSRGKYGMKAVMGDGTKRRVENLNTTKKRSDS